MKNIMYLISIIVCPIVTLGLGLQMSDLNKDPYISCSQFVFGIVLGIVGLAGCLNVAETLYKTIRKFMKEH